MKTIFDLHIHLPEYAGLSNRNEAHIWSSGTKLASWLLIVKMFFVFILLEIVISRYPCFYITVANCL